MIRGDHWYAVSILYSDFIWYYPSHAEKCLHSNFGMFDLYPKKRIIILQNRFFSLKFHRNSWFIGKNGGLDHVDPSSPLPDLVQHQPFVPGSKVSEMPSGTLLLLHGRVDDFQLLLCFWRIVKSVFFVFHSGSLKMSFLDIYFQGLNGFVFCFSLKRDSTFVDQKVATVWLP